MAEESQTGSHLGDADGGGPASGPDLDLELVQAILGKLRERLIQFLDRLECVPRILQSRNRALGRPLDDAELEDVAQETLSVVWRKLPQFEGRSSLETWIYRIAVFELMNAIRSRSRRRWQSTPIADKDQWAAASPHEFDDYSDLYGALELLNAEEADVIRAKHFDDVAFSEIARLLSISEGTAKTRYYRGMKRLNVMLRHRKGDLN